MEDAKQRDLDAKKRSHTTRDLSKAWQPSLSTLPDLPQGSVAQGSVARLHRGRFQDEESLGGMLLDALRVAMVDLQDAEFDEDVIKLLLEVRQ